MTIETSRGKVLRGSSSINMMAYSQRIGWIVGSTARKRGASTLPSKRSGRLPTQPRALRRGRLAGG
jgi:hypothetical protein